MKIDNPSLADGYSAVQPGKLATVVTCLEMFGPPEPKPVIAGETFALAHWLSPQIDEYRSLYRAVGEYWLWTSRLVMADETLRKILSHPDVEIHVLMQGERRIGLLELDFRKKEECELAFFGLVGDAIGMGGGRFLMNQAIEKAWERPIRRFWVHTCHLDSPAALPFYQRSGFTPFRQMIEIVDDPRLTGLMPAGACPHVPLIRP